MNSGQWNPWSELRLLNDLSQFSSEEACYFCVCKCSKMTILRDFWVHFKCLSLISSYSSKFFRCNSSSITSSSIYLLLSYVKQVELTSKWHNTIIYYVQL